ncbi:hypothetical protein [Geothrix sp. SG200]|uniref:hypothetical protein n=1 Tax=Geothrix sp. SG200 TaxID=2922865 RepID=UPI001FAC249E|nr:hypothetical protein [Geothrix sp. SG200]
MFVAVGRIPGTPEAVARAARLAGLALPDAARMLAGTLPRILARATPDGEGLAAALVAEGFLAWAAEPSAVPTDGTRLVVRSLDWEPGGFRAVDAKGQTHPCPLDAVRLLQRGARTQSTTEVLKTKERRFDLGKAVLSGGLLLTKKVEKVEERTTHAKEPFLLVQRGDGHPDLMVYEHGMDYRCLGADMRPATLANLALLSARFQALCPQAPLDDRVGRPGFVAGLPHLPVDPVDLALDLVSEARRRGC